MDNFRSLLLTPHIDLTVIPENYMIIVGMERERHDDIPSQYPLFTQDMNNVTRILVNICTVTVISLGLWTTTVKEATLGITVTGSLRDWWSFLEVVFVGQCEVFVCLGFLEIISFLYFFPWPRSS